MFEAERLKKLHEAATPGPWELCAHLESPEADAGCRCGYRGVVYGPERDGFAVFQPGHDPEIVGQEGLGPQRYPRVTEIANSQLLAYLRNAVPAILAMAEREKRMREALERIAKASSTDAAALPFTPWAMQETARRALGEEKAS